MKTLDDVLNETEQDENAENGGGGDGDDDSGFEWVGSTSGPVPLEADEVLGVGTDYHDDRFRVVYQRCDGQRTNEIRVEYDDGGDWRPIHYYLAENGVALSDKGERISGVILVAAWTAPSQRQFQLITERLPGGLLVAIRAHSTDDDDDGWDRVWETSAENFHSGDEK